MTPEEYAEIHKKYAGTMECCKYDCKTKECRKGKFCIDILINYGNGDISLEEAPANGN